MSKTQTYCLKTLQVNSYRHEEYTAFRGIKTLKATAAQVTMTHLRSCSPVKAKALTTTHKTNSLVLCHYLLLPRTLYNYLLLTGP